MGATQEGEEEQEEEDWVLVDGTPATATQLGLFHLFPRGSGSGGGGGGGPAGAAQGHDSATSASPPPFDLVISGPNYGRNTTALFSLSSGTVGGAMEAATFGVRAVALSFAFWTSVYDASLVERACRHSVELVEGLVRR